MAWVFRSIVDALKGLIIEADNEDVDFICDIQPKAAAEKSDSSNIAEMSGVISKVQNDYITINDEYLFELGKTNEDYKIGDMVWFKLLLMANGSRPVVSVGKIKTNNKEDGDWEDWSSASAEVTGFNGSTVYLSNSVVCNFKDVDSRFGYLPTPGDRVDITTENVSGKQVVKSLRPSGLQQATGAVSDVSGTNGVIISQNKPLEFQGGALSKTYVPRIGDQVQFWAVDHALSGRRPFNIEMIEDVDNEQETIFDVQVSRKVDFGELYLDGPEKELIINIKNTGREIIQLVKCTFRREQCQFSIAKLDCPVVVEGFGSIGVSIKLKPEFVGSHVEIIDLYFDKCKISRFVSCTVTTKTILDSYSNARSYTRRNMQLPSDYSQEQRTYGNLPFKLKKFRRPLDRYCIPPKMKEALEQFVQEKDIRRGLVAAFPVLLQNLSFQNYATKLHILLYLEEAFVMMECNKLTQNCAFMKRYGQRMLLPLPGVKDQRLSLLVGDQAIVTQPLISNNLVHVGFIHNIQNQSILIDFHESFMDSYKGTECCVQFKCSTTLFRKMHRAIQTVMLRKNVENVLFPTRIARSAPLITVKEEHIGWFNTDLNAIQRRAVVNALRATCRPLPYIIFGPPGTGKTFTVVETILQLMRLGSCKILVCAPSNSAANLITKRLTLYCQFSQTELVRLVAASHHDDEVDPDIKEFCVTYGVDEMAVPLGYHKITIGTCSSVDCLQDATPMPKFTHLIVDEAGYAFEPMTLIPMSLLSNTGTIILAGDPKQLGPHVSSRMAYDFGLKESYLLRLTQTVFYSRNLQEFPNNDGYNPELITILQINYRSVPEILALPNRLFYNSFLEAAMRSDSGREGEIISAFFEMYPIGDRPVAQIFHGVVGKNLQESDSPSWFNPEEIFVALMYVKRLMKINVLPSEIGIIAPYRKQVLKIRQLLRDLCGTEDIKVASVDEFQGQERPVIILSAVRSNADHLNNDKVHLLGFLCDPARLNVSLTRARAMLIAIGNPNVLSCEPHWRELVAQCLKTNSYVGCSPPNYLMSTIPQEKNVPLKMTEPIEESPPQLEVELWDSCDTDED